MARLAAAWETRFSLIEAGAGRGRTARWIKEVRVRPSASRHRLAFGVSSWFPGRPGLVAAAGRSG